MNLNELKYFITVVDEKSFSNAAKKLYTSQPSLTMSIKNLESELGSTLLIRKRGDKNMILTNDGEFVYIHAKKIIQEINNIFEEIEDNKAKIKLGVPSIIGAYIFPNVMSFMTPSILESLDFVETGSANMKKLFDENKIKMAIIGTLSPTINPDFDRYFIMRDSYYVFVSSKHPLAKNKSISFNQLKSERFISLGENYLQYRVLKQLCLKENMESKINDFIISNEFETVNSLISSGAGIGIMTSYSLGNRKDISMIPLRNPVYCYFYLIFKKNYELSKSEIEVKADIIRANSGYKQ